MPIPVDCKCGWSKSVKDEYAGKRAKCPQCGTVLTVPSPLSLEDAAAATLMEDGAELAATPKPRYTEEELSPSRGSYRVDTTSKPTPIEIQPKPKKPRKRASRDERFVGTPRIVLSPGVTAAIGSLLLGGVWVAVGLSNGRIPIYGVVMVFVGFFRLINGFLGHPED